MAGDFDEDDLVMDLDSDTCLMSEDSLARIWNRPEEDAAWAYLQIYHTPPYPLLGWKNDPRTVP
jgi:hypothetical protein